MSPKFAIGHQVFGCAALRMGAHGEYICLPDTYTIAAKPKNMSYAEAAAVPLGGLNALHYLNRANIQKGEKVLINGAGGSIGTFAIQIAKAHGAEVTAIDTGIKEETLRRIGADYFIDYQKDDFLKAGQTYDVIFDMVAESSYSGIIKHLNPKGRYLKANPRLSDMLRSIWTPIVSRKQVIFAFAGEKEEELLTLKDMIEQGSIKSTVDKIYPMAQISEAHRRVETEQRLGTIVLSIVE